MVAGHPLLINHFLMGLAFSTAVVHPAHIDANSVALEVNCPYGCGKCSRFNGCLWCKPPYFMVLHREGAQQTAGCSKECPPGFYQYARKKSGFCIRCPSPGCLECVHGPKCIRCDVEFQLRSGHCIKEESTTVFERTPSITSARTSTSTSTLSSVVSEYPVSSTNIPTTLSPLLAPKLNAVEAISAAAEQALSTGKPLRNPRKTRLGRRKNHVRRYNRRRLNTTQVIVMNSPADVTNLSSAGRSRSAESNRLLKRKRRRRRKRRKWQRKNSSKRRNRRRKKTGKKKVRLNVTDGTVFSSLNKDTRDSQSKTKSSETLKKKRPRRKGLRKHYRYMSTRRRRKLGKCQIIYCLFNSTSVADLMDVSPEAYIVRRRRHHHGNGCRGKRTVKCGARTNPSKTGSTNNTIGSFAFKNKKCIKMRYVCPLN